jgi:uncharacterized membrane protein YphA (DoxX/SURF4 family)
MTNKFSSSILLIRIMIGTIFLSEGIQKILYPAVRGVGRFIKIGLPAPEFLGYFVASFEIVCGVLILIGLFTRYAALPLIIIMITAISSTKIPILLNEGFWEMAHAARTDWAMILGSIFLLIVGSGKLSIDSYLTKKNHKKN